MNVDLSETSNCPSAVACELCRRSVAGLTVVAASTAVGVLCLTLCPPCRNHNEGLALISRPDALRAVLRHCIHLGVTLEEIGAFLHNQRNTE